VDVGGDGISFSLIRAFDPVPYSRDLFNVLKGSEL